MKPKSAATRMASACRIHMVVGGAEATEGDGTPRRHELQKVKADEMANN